MPPLGLAYLAANLLKNGEPVSLIDAHGEGISWKKLRKIVENMRPDVLGLSAMSPVRHSAYRAARLLRPFVRHIVLGGPHPAAVGRQVFDECPEIDFAVLGEGEDILVQLVHQLAQTSGKLVPVPGVISKLWDGSTSTAA